MKRWSGAAAMAALLFHAVPAWAQEADLPDLTLNGFGTLGTVHSNEDQADFTGSIFAPKGAGHSSSLSHRVDSRLGLQATTRLTRRLSGIVQVVSEQQYDGTFRPLVNWANVRFDATPDLSLRAGRVMLPTFMVSEYRKVGYAMPWIRPPEEVYGLVPVTSTDGAAASYRARVRDFTNTLQLTYGGKDEKIPFFDPETGSLESAESESRGGLTITNTLERGGLTLHAGYTRTRLTIEEFNELFDVYRMFGEEGEAIADRFDIDDKRFEVYNLGARYDAGNWFLLGEWAEIESRTFILDRRAWYVTGGYRYGSVTPYLTFARTRVLESTSHPGLSQPGSDDLDAALNEILGGQPEQKSVAVGARWDLARNAALKVQYDYFDLDDDSPGVLLNRQPDFEPGGSVSLVSIAVDFVF